MHDALLVHMVYTNKGGKLMLDHPSLNEIKLQLYLSGSDEYYKKTFHYSYQARVLYGILFKCDALLERWLFCQDW
jgi:hypothetical protein